MNSTQRSQLKITSQLTKYQDEILMSFLKTRSESKKITMLHLKYEAFSLQFHLNQEYFE